MIRAGQVVAFAGANVERRALHRLRIKAGGGRGRRIKRISLRIGCQGKIHAGPTDRVAQVVRHQSRNCWIGRQAKVDVHNIGGVHRDDLVGGIAISDGAGAHIPRAVDDIHRIGAIGGGNDSGNWVGGGIRRVRDINGDASQRRAAAIGYFARNAVRWNAHRLHSRKRH